MNLVNHVVGGVVCTSVFGSLAGYNVLSSPALVGVTLLGCVISDIDHPSSTVGRLLKPISVYLNDRYGHRTITHSLIFLVVLYMVSNLTNYFLQVEGLAFIFTLSIFVHIVLDMMTISGVEFLYPFSKTLFVLPENPSYRFSNQDRSSQLVILAVFLISGIFMRPLMEDGFWTSYNRLFGTMKHLQSEYLKADDLLFAEFEIKNGSHLYKRTGYVLEANEREALIYSEGLQIVVPGAREVVKNVVPEHSGITFKFVPSSEVCDEACIFLDDGFALLPSQSLH